MFEKLQNISQIEDGDIVHDIFIVKSTTSIIPYVNDTKYRFELTLADKSKEIKAKYWGNENQLEINALHQKLSKNKVIHIKARAQSFNNIIELNINCGDITIVPDDKIPKSAFLETTTKQIDKMLQEILNIITTIQDLEYKSLLNIFFQDQDFINKFKESPATMFHHHNLIGGLLEHTLNITKLANFIATQSNNQNNNSKIDKDFLITICILHGIGKLDQLNTTIAIDYTEDGALLGDTYLAANKIQTASNNINLSKSKKLKLINAILSQKGNKLGAKKPATPEALILSKIKDLDSSLSHMLKIVSEYQQTQTISKGDDQDQESFIWHKEFGNIFLK